MTWTSGEGANSIGVYRPPGTRFNNTTGGQWLLRNEMTAGNPDIDFAYGGPGDIPVVGNWTGNANNVGGPGPTIGVYRPPETPFNNTTGGQWLLRTRNTAGNPDIQFAYGGPGDIPVVGDWTGSGQVTVGVYRPPGTPFNNTTGGQWLLREELTAGNPDIEFAYGGPGDIPVVGAWTGPVKDAVMPTTIGVYRPPGSPLNNTTGGQWLLRNSNTAGNPDIDFAYGGPGDIPVVAEQIYYAAEIIIP